MLPTNVVLVPSVAELPTLQNTLHDWPPLIITTEELVAVTKVLPVRKIKTADALPCAFRVTVPVIAADEAKQ